MLLNFLNVTLRNFLSVGNVTQSIRLDINGLTLVLGNNTDVGNSGAANSRNGVGKTSLLQSISYALFGEPLTNIKLDNLINSINQKDMLVTIEFEINGDGYRIERGRKPNIFKFYKNNKQSVREESDSLGENKHTQEEINRLLGMDHTLFCHIVAMNTYTTPFLKMKPADQREVIEQLLGVVTLSERDEKLVDIIKETKRLIKDEEAMIKAVSDSNARIQIAISRGENESHSWKIALQSSVAKIQDSIESLAHIDFDAELVRFDEIDAFNDEYTSLVASVKEEQRETNELRKEMVRLSTSKKEHEANFSRISDTQIDRLRVELRRCKAEAEKGCEAEIEKLNAEIARCNREAEKTCDAEIDRLELQVSRRRADAAKKIKASEAKGSEMEAIMAEVENADGHTCSTCGQGLEGTDHLEKILLNLAAKAERLQEAIEKDLADAAVLESEADDIAIEIRNVRENHVSVQQTWLDKAARIEAEISEVIKTHSASQVEWQKKAEDVQTEIVSAQQALEDRKAETLEIINDLSSQLAALTITIDERDESETELVAALADMKSSAPEPITYSSREETWKARERHNTLLKDLEREQAKENPHDAYVLSLKETLQEVSYETLNQYNDDWKHQEFIHKLLTTKDSFIRKKIIDRNLYLLNSKLSKYLTLLGLPHEVKFKPDLTVEITHMARDFDFEQLSRGEMNRVILAVSWSFRDIWEELNNQINLLFVDEIATECGMDDAGAEAALEVLLKFSHRGKNVFLVSHKESLIGKVDKILMVNKEEKFTRFELSEN
jgi:DNA repair exonuclease SbcCD ATPase subunit